MSFQLFAPLFEEIDDITKTFVTDLSSRIIAEITPFVTISMTLTLIIYGILIMRGVITMPITDFISRTIRIGIITSIVLSGGLYQRDIAELITTLPDTLVQALIPSSINIEGNNAADIIDHAANNSLYKAGEAFEKSGIFSSAGIAYALFGILIIVITGMMIGVGGAFIILSKIALALLAGLGPFFIASLLFQPTYRFFELWLSQILNYILTIILFSAIFGFTITIYSNYMQSFHFDGLQNIAYSLGGTAILGIASTIIVLQIPSIASSLAGGISISYISELRNLHYSGKYLGNTTKKMMADVTKGKNNLDNFLLSLDDDARNRKVLNLYKK